MNPEQPTLANLEAQQRELLEQILEISLRLILDRENKKLMMKVLFLENQKLEIENKLKELEKLENLIREN